MMGARRRCLHRTIALAVALVTCGGATAAAANPITTENAKAGDAAWRYPRANAGATTTRRITVASAAGAGTNLIGNRSFETALTGWGAYAGTLTLVPQTGAPNGAHIARAALTSGGSYRVDEGATNITKVTVGATNLATAWVKGASTPAVGRPVNLTLRERTTRGTVVADVAGPTPTLSSPWQGLTVTRVATTAGADLGGRISQGSAASGDAIFADAFRVAQGP